MRTRPRALLVLAVLVALVAGTVAYVAGRTGADTGKPGAGAVRAATAPTGRPRPPDAFRGEVLIWAPGGFSRAEVNRVLGSTRVAAISAVRTGQLALASRLAGWPVIPAEAMAVDPDAYTRAVGQPGTDLAGMLRRGAVLSVTEARLRRLAPGGKLRLVGGQTLAVAGIVPDELLGGYEVALDKDAGAALGLTHAGYLLVRPRGGRPALERAVRGLLAGRDLRFHSPGERPYFRAGDGVLPQALVKARFGEFALRSLDATTPDPRWVRAHMARRAVPVLGLVRCHRLVLDDLAAAMGDVRRAHLESSIDVDGVRREGGCYAPQLVPGDQTAPSRHAWGIAIDLDAAANPPGGPPRADARLVAIMARHGFTWGGRWLPPDGGRFEWVGAGA